MSSELYPKPLGGGQLWCFPLARKGNTKHLLVAFPWQPELVSDETPELALDSTSKHLL